LFINAWTRTALRTYTRYCIGPMSEVISLHSTSIKSWGQSCIRSQCGIKWKLSRLWRHSKLIASSGQLRE